MPKRQVATILVCALALLTAGAWAEDGYGIAAYLLRGITRDMSAESFYECIQPIDVIAQADDIRLHIDEAITDGELMAVSWVIENTRPEAPVIVEIEDIRVGGEPVRVWSDSLTEQWQPRMFALGSLHDRLAPQSGGMVTFLREDRMEGVLEVALTLAISRPVGELVIVDPSLYEPEWADHPDFLQMLDEIEASGILVAGEEALDAEDWFGRGYTPITRDGRLQLFEDGLIKSFNRLYWEREGLMERGGTLEVAFVLDASLQQSQPVDIAFPEAFAYGEGAELTIQRMTLSPLSTLLEMEIARDTAGDEGASMSEMPAFAFFNADGEMLEYLSIDRMWGFRSPELVNGKSVSRYDDPLPGLIGEPAYFALGGFGFFAGQDGIDTLDKLKTVADPLLIIPLAEAN